MADDEEKEPTHSEVEIDRNLRTRDDKVFFPGTAQVDKRTEKSIDKAIAEEDAIQNGEVAEEESDDLGDTRTSTEQKKAAGKKGNSRRK